MCSYVKRIKVCNGIVQSEYDDRKYRQICLENGLRAVLISDLKDGEECMSEESDEEDNIEEEVEGSEDDDSGAEDDGDGDGTDSEQTKKKSAAALCIGVGSFSDLDDIPGFAHFLEHMVFMGSTKYPGENELDEFITTRGGETNAWTDMERTCFYFGVEQKYFYRALDRFANFFISPLFKEDTVDREINAVDSEFQMNLTEDDVRCSAVINTLAREGHVMRKFTLGNAETLRDIPKRDGLNIYNQLRGFFNRYYSAHYMTLAIHSNDTLDRMEAKVREIFSPVPNNNTPQPAYEILEKPFEDSSFHKVVRVVPVKDIHRLWISWPCPPSLHKYKTKPLDILDCLLTHEGKGSILSLLKKKAWAVELIGNMSYQGSDHNSTWSWFLLSIQLTPEGFQHYKQVVLIVFQYLQMLRSKFELIAGFYEEQKKIGETNFRWKEKIDPIEYVEKVSENMQLFSEEDILTGRSQFYQYDSQMVKSYLEHLIPERCNIVLMAKELEPVCSLEERFFKVKYNISNFDDDLELMIKDVQNNPDLSFPEPNQYIASEFAIKTVKDENLNKVLLPLVLLQMTILELPPIDCKIMSALATEAIYPVLLKEDDYVKLWYKKDTKFLIPKGFIYLHLLSPVVYESPEKATMFDVYVNLLTQTLNEVAYPAIMANYDFSIDGHKTGMEISMDGFSHKLPELLKTIMKEVFNLSTTEEFYKAICTEVKKSYHNEMLKTDELCRFLRFAVLEPVQWTFSEKSQCMEAVREKFEEFKIFVKEFQSKLFIEAFVIGNFTPEEAVEYADMIKTHMKGSAVPHDQQFKKLCRQVPKSSYYCQHFSHNLGDANSTITVYLQSEPGSFYTSCLNQLLQWRIKEPCFDVLRTKHQLGYEVYSLNHVTYGILGMSINVEFQAHKFSMFEVDQFILKFLEDFKSTLDELTQDEFENLIASLIVSKQTEDSNLGEEATRYWREIFDQKYVFDILEKEISTLKTITLDRFKTWYLQYLPPECRRISFQILGYKDKTDVKPCDFNVKESKGFVCNSDKDFLGVNQIENIEKSVSNWEVYPPTKITS